VATARSVAYSIRLDREFLVDCDSSGDANVGARAYSGARSDAILQGAAWVVGFEQRSLHSRECACGNRGAVFATSHTTTPSRFSPNFSSLNISAAGYNDRWLTGGDLPAFSVSACRNVLQPNWTRSRVRSPRRSDTISRYRSAEARCVVQTASTDDLPAPMSFDGRWIWTSPSGNMRLNAKVCHLSLSGGL